MVFEKEKKEPKEKNIAELIMSSDK